MVGAERRTRRGAEDDLLVQVREISAQLGKLERAPRERRQVVRSS